MMTQDSRTEVLAGVEQAQDPHRSLHSETGALPGEHPGRSGNPLRPGRPAPSAGVDAAGLEDLPHGRRCDVNAQASQLTVDPPVPPFGVLAGQPMDQGLDVRRVAGRPVLPYARSRRKSSKLT